MLSSTVAAAVVVPFVLQGDLRGKLYEAKCGETARSGIASLLEAGRDPLALDPVLVSTGDLLAPNPRTQYPIEHGGDAHEALARALSRPDGTPIFDAILPGNFELSLDRPKLTSLSERAGLRWTIANLAPRFPSERERIVTRGGVRIGITGALDETLASKLSPVTRAEKLEPAIKALAESVGRLRAAGANVVVVLLHVSAGEGPKAIVRIVKGLGEEGATPDLVMASNLEGGVSLIRMGDRGTPVIPAPQGWSSAAVALLRVEPNGASSLESARVVKLAVADDARFDAVHEIVCADLDVALSPRAPAGPVDKPTFLTFLLELMRRTTGAEIAILNRGAFGGDFPMTAPITALDLQRAIPFENSLQIAEVKGAKLAPLVPLADNPNAIVLGIAKGKAAGRAIDDLRPYRVVTIDFVADGGDDLIKPGTIPFTRREDLPSLRALASEFIRSHGLETDADEDEDLVIDDPLLLGARLQLGGTVKNVRISNPEKYYQAPQLAQEAFVGGTATIDLRLAADWPRHRVQLDERTRFGFAKNGDMPLLENEDVTRFELSYVSRLAGPDRHWAIPDALVAASLETEFTKPDTRRYHRALLEAGVGPAWLFLEKKLGARSRIGLRRELLARDDDTADADEKASAETKLALLSTVELLDFAAGTVGATPIVVGARIDHALDFSGRARDNILQGRIGIDVPIYAYLSATAALEFYVQHRDEDGASHRVGSSLNTTFGLKTTTDLSAALY